MEGVMGRAWISVIGKAIDLGSACAHHVSFIQRLHGHSLVDQTRMLRDYTGGLSDAGFTGLKLTLGMLLGTERDAARKSIMRQALASADQARWGGAIAESPQVAPLSSIEQPATDYGLDNDLALVCAWRLMPTQEQREQALAAYIGGLSPGDYEGFIRNVQQMQVNVEENLRQLHVRENNAFGGFVEDRINYMMARLKTGQRSPAILERFAEFQDTQQLLAWTVSTSEAVWRARAAARRLPAASPPTPHVDPEVVKQALVDFCRTGQYPGGPEQCSSDVLALIAQGEADGITAMFHSMGGAEGGDKVLNIKDHYRPGVTLYQLRWPLTIKLPIPFDELDRPTQFSVLWGEWSAREVAGGAALLRGDKDAAQAAFGECLARAEQLEVPELIARSHEGLARLADKHNQRAEQRQHLKAAVSARSVA
jgi:hypothetical protein